MNIIKALRLLFLPASILPYFLGVAFAARNCEINIIRIIFGAVIVALTHLSANLINDYADSKSGADWNDLKGYIFFGGSKLIQKQVFSEKWFLTTAIAGYSFVLIFLVIFTVVYGPWYIFPIGLAVGVLSAGYSLPPLKLVYRGVGELTVMILFGPVVVCGGACFATGGFPNVELILLSAPIACWIGAVLLCNEIADLQFDKKVDKKNLAVRLGFRKASLLYSFLIFIAAVFIINLNLDYKIIIALAEICFGITGCFLINKYNGSPEKMKIPAKITIIGHSLTIISLSLFVL